MESNLSFREFCERVVDNIRAELPIEYADASIGLQDVVKNNDTVLHGLMIKTDDVNIAPNIYLDGYFRAYQDGKSFDSILEDIANVRVKNNLSADFEVSNLTSWENVKDRISLRLVNAELNATYLVGKPHTLVKDLAVVYCVDLGANEAGKMTAPITDQLLESYGVSKAELHEAALGNIEKISRPSIKTMTETMVDMMLPDMLRNGMSEEEARESISHMIPPTEEEAMYVVTNEDKIHGAAVLLDEKFMDEVCAKVGKDFYILPSSVHECLVVPARDEVDLHTLENMVYDVNRTQVSPEEKLSDNVYAYDADKHELIMGSDLEKRLNERETAETQVGGAEVQPDTVARRHRGR